jgi:hypothetical protein
VAGKTFLVARDASISIDYKPGKFDALPIGAYVNLNLTADQTTARHVWAQGPYLGGFGGATVKAVNAAKNEITFDDRAEDGMAGKTFTLARDGTVSIDGKRGKLTDVPPGCCVNLRLTADRRKALHIEATGPFVACDFGGSVVKAVDLEKSTITFDDKARSEVAGKTFVVARDAIISIDAKRGKLADIPLGCCVSLRLTADQSAALNVQAEGPYVACDCGGSLVKAVDYDRSTITFDDKARAEVAGKTFVVARDANITVDGRRGKLTDLPTGCYVSLRLSADQTAALQVNAQGPSNVCDCGGSLVKAVDVEKRTITFDDKARAEVAGKTFALAKDAIIAIDGGPGTLAALPVGSYVQMNLCSDRQTVGMIFAQGPPVPGVGVVKAVDAEKNLITVEDTTYPVAKNANILVDGKTVQLTGVRAGIHVTLRLCVDQKTVGTIFHTKAPDDGKR